MGSLPKIVSVMSCGFLLCLGLSFTVPAGIAVSATDKMKADQSGERIGGQAGLGYDQPKRERVAARAGERIDSQAGQNGDQLMDGTLEGTKMIEGEVLRAEDDSLFVKTEDGNEMLLHIDPTTQKPRNIDQGEGIQARVNDQSHVLAILSESAVHDRRNAK